MKTGVERIYELLDELAEVSKEMFPKCTRVTASCDSDGYRSFTILQWERGKPIEKSKRRVFLSQSKFADEDDWEADRSPIQNAYYEREGVLLKDD